MKNLKRILLITMCLLALLSVMASADNEGITVYVDGKQIDFPDQEPVIKNDITLVPVRFIAEGLGYNVEWQSPKESNTKKGVAVINDGKIKLEIGTVNAEINGEKITLEVGIELIGDRTMIPLRMISETLGCTVDWYNESSMIRVSSNPPDLVWNRIKDSGTLTLIENSSTGYYGCLVKNPEEVNDMPRWLMKQNSNMLNYGVEQYDSEIKIHKYDEKTLKEVHDILMIVYPTGYEEVYDMLMRAIKGELWECLVEGTPYLATGTFGTHYIDNREVVIYAAYGLPYVSITINKPGYVNPDKPITLTEETVSELTKEAKNNYPLKKFGLE